MLEGWKADKGNDKTADEMFDAYVKFYNACFERPSDMHLGIHLCRGNYMGSRHFSEGAYDNIAKKMFNASRHFCPNHLKHTLTINTRTSTSTLTTSNTTPLAPAVSSPSRSCPRTRMSSSVS